LYKQLKHCFLILLVALAAMPPPASCRPVALKSGLHAPFRFIAYGDTRFTDPANTAAANAEIRRELVRAIADARPGFVTFGGDIAYNGDNPDDWKVYDRETAIWRERRIPVYPALGNHDLHGDQSVALRNYFARFPRLRHSRYYSVQGQGWLMLTLDSGLDELSGPQGRWLHYRLEHVPARAAFIFIVFHHPPYTSSSDEKTFGGGHSARPQEQKLGAYFEARQKTLRARIVVFNGHNYERHEHGGVTYFVTGGGGAHAYPITRAPGDPFQSQEINYHYLVVEVRRHQLKATMNRLEMKGGVATWTQPDSITISSRQARNGPIISGTDSAGPGSTPR
jgi:acid phosphatase type 7